MFSEDLVKDIKNELFKYDPCNFHDLIEACKNLTPFSQEEMNEFELHLGNIPEELKFYLTNISRVFLIYAGSEPYVMITKPKIYKKSYIMIASDCTGNVYYDFNTGLMSYYDTKLDINQIKFKSSLHDHYLWRKERDQFNILRIKDY